MSEASRIFNREPPSPRDRDATDVLALLKKQPMTEDDKKPKPGIARTPRNPDDGRRDLFKPRLPGEGEPPDIDLGHIESENDEDTGPDESADAAPEALEETQERAAAARAAQADYDRRDRAFTEVKFGQPRIAVLSDRSLSVMRLSDVDLLEVARDLGPTRFTDDRTKLRLLESLDEPLTLAGPSEPHAIDMAISATYDEFPQFGAALQTVRESAQLSLARGAMWLNFRPVLIVSPPGLGKSSFASKLASNFALPLVTLDGSTITTSTPLLGGDAIYRSSRASDIVQAFSTHGIGNPLVVFDEVDKTTDTSKGGRENPAEALLGFLEQRTSGRLHDHYLGIDLDMSHLNWILLANDLERVPRPVRDRCKVIQMAPLSAQQIAEITAREIDRRALSPDLLPAIVKGCVQGQIKSLRKLTKILDAAEAVMKRPRFH